MRKKFTLAFLPLMICSFLFTACLSNDEEDTTEYSSESALTAIQLGNLYRTLHTTNVDGEDSTYYGIVAGSSYLLTIDQKNSKIFNLKKLPYETLLNKTIFSTLTSSGITSIKTLTTGVDTIISTSDTIDASIDRLITVYAYDGLSTHTYTLHLNIENQEKGTLAWTNKATNSKIAALQNQKLFVKDKELFLFGTNEEGNTLLNASTVDPTVWTTQTGTGMENIELSSIILFKDKFFALDGNNIITSTNGINWSANSSDLTPEVLIACSSNSLYAIKEETIYSSEDGISWIKDSLDTEEALPTSDYASVVIPSVTNTNIENVIFLGNKDEKVMVWQKNEDLNKIFNFPWNYYSIINNNSKLPAFYNTKLIGTQHYIFALGKKDNKFSEFYISYDNGRTWDTDEDYPTPDLSNASAVGMSLEGDDIFWITCNNTGTVWRGTLK